MAELLDIAVDRGHIEIVELLKKQEIKEAQQIGPPASSIRPREQPIADVISTGETIGDDFGDYVNVGKDVNGDGHNDIFV